MIAICFFQNEGMAFSPSMFYRKKYEIAVAPIPDNNEESGDDDSFMSSTFESEHEIEATPSITEIPRKIIGIQTLQTLEPGKTGTRKRKYQDTLSDILEGTEGGKHGKTGRLAKDQKNIKWHKKNNKVADKEIPFIDETCGPSQDVFAACSSPVDYFLTFLSPDIVDNIVAQSNQYAIWRQLK